MKRFGGVFILTLLLLYPFADVEAAKRPIKSATYLPFAGTPYSDTAAVIDVKTGKFLYRENATKKRAIASLTKIVTSMVFLESQPNLEEVITYSSSYDREGTSVDVVSGDQLTLFDVLMSTLVQSANNMAVTLSASTPMSQTDFVKQMNMRVQELGLKSTSFVEPTGLDSLNSSTAGNLARLARYAFTEHRGIFISALYNPRYTFTLQNQAKSVQLHTTNNFPSNEKYEVLAFKTGYLPYDAFRTLIIEVRERATGNDIIVVLMGNQKYGTIFQEAQSLTDWTFENWDFPVQ